MKEYNKDKIFDIMDITQCNLNYSPNTCECD